MNTSGIQLYYAFESKSFKAFYYKDFSYFKYLLKESDACMRICCGPARSFTSKINNFIEIQTFYTKISIIFKKSSYCGSNESSIY
jgi:hypothetical protein